jgi:hypothetical protein
MLWSELLLGRGLYSKYCTVEGLLFLADGKDFIVGALRPGPLWDIRIPHRLR